jgi:hypothetical protein
MSNKKKLVGATLAAAAALVFATVPVTSAFADTASTIQCNGGNACKGQSACKTASNACKGQNACKGKGFMMTPTANDCTQAGGTPA